MPETLNESIIKLDIAQVLDKALNIQVKVFGPGELELIKTQIESLRLSNPLRWVDIGCGSGAFTVAAAKRFATDSFIGLDNNAHLLEEAKKRTGDNVQFEHVDAETDDLNSYLGDADVVVARYTIQHIKEYEALIQKIYSAMKKGAVFLAIEGVFEENKEDVPGGAFNDCIARLKRFYEAVGSDDKMRAKLPGAFSDVGFKGVEQQWLRHGSWNGDRSDFISLVLSCAVLVNKMKPEIMPEKVIQELEDYMCGDSSRRMYFTTSVTMGVKG